MKAHFVTGYFGGKTYATNGIAFIPEPGTQGTVIILASFCGTGFVAERQSKYTDYLRGEEVEVPAEVLVILKRLLDAGRGISDAAGRKLRRLLGPQLTFRIHTDPSLSA